MPLIRITETDLEARIAWYEKKHADFKESWEQETCCSSCRVDWTNWDGYKLDDWGDYDSYRFLRGDEINYERDED